MGCGRVAEHGDRDATLHELPGGEPRALEERPRFIREHLEATARVPGGGDHGERGARAPGGEGTRVAVREHAAFGEHRSSVPTDRLAEPPILVVDRAGLREQGLSQCCRVGLCRKSVDGTEAPLDRPAKVYGGGAGGSEFFGPHEHVSPRVAGGHLTADRLASSHSHAIAARDADRRGAAHPQALDRLDDGGHVVAREPGELSWEQRLIDEFEVAGGLANPAERNGDHGRVVEGTGWKPVLRGEKRRDS